MIKPDFEAWARREINRLIDQGEEILNRCSLETFMAEGGPPARQNAIELWLADAQRQIPKMLVDPNDAAPLSPVRLAEAIDTLAPQPPSAAQLRQCFVDFMNERLQLLNAMIGR